MKALRKMTTPRPPKVSVTAEKKKPQAGASGKSKRARAAVIVQESV